MRRLRVRDLLQTDTITLREQHKTYCYSDRKSRFFFWDYVSLCACLRGTHSIMRRIWVDTSHSRSIAGVEEEEEDGGRGREGGRDELFNQPALLGSDVLLCLMGRWGELGNNKQHLLNKAAVTWQPQDRASKEPRFSRGQGIISESSSRIIAPSQNDSHRCGTPSQIAGLSLPTHRTKWQPLPRW